MKVAIRDTEALKAVSPAALSAYARAAGWKKTGEVYREHSDVYEARDRPEILVPRTERLGDYADVVGRLIEIFARVAETDQQSLYRDLVTADRDVIRVRAAQEQRDGTVAVKAGLDLLRGAHDMLLSAARSLRDPRPLYQGRPDRDAADYMKRIRLGQTEHGRFAVALLTPIVSPLMRPTLVGGGPSDDESMERRMTRRLTVALASVQSAIIDNEGEELLAAVEHGASANLCEALVMLIESFQGLDVSVTWACTLPRPKPRDVFRFAPADAPILREAAQLFSNEWSFGIRERLKRSEAELREEAGSFRRPDERLFGVPEWLSEAKTEDSIALRASVDGQSQLVTVNLQASDYALALAAYQTHARVEAEGDLVRTGQRWRLLNARVVSILDDKKNSMLAML